MTRPNAASAAGATGETQMAGFVPFPDATTVSKSCQLLNPASELGPAASGSSTSLSTLITPPGGVYSFRVTTTEVYVINGSGLLEYAANGSFLRAIPLPSALTTNRFNGSVVGSNSYSQPVVDASGNVYIASSQGGSVAAFSPSGQLMWTVSPSGGPTNIFSDPAPNGTFQLGVSTSSSNSSLVYSAAGAQIGTVNLWVPSGAYTDREPNGDTLLADGKGYVQTWSPDATTLISEFGSRSVEGQGQHTGSSYSFFYPGQATLGPDGNVYAANGMGTITVTAPDGVLIGTTTLGGAVKTDGEIQQVGGNLYLVNRPPFDATHAVVSVVPVSTVQAMLSAPQATRNALGWGAGLSSTQAANYFPAGTPVDIYASFDSWWSSISSHFQLRYQVWDDSASTTGTTPPTTTVTLPTSTSALSRMDLTIPVADQVSGPYEVQAELYDTSTTPPTEVGATCMPYTVGTASDSLSLASLPPGSGAGGPTDQRGVVLNSQLGLDGYRGLPINWSTFLPNCNASAPTAASCGPTAMTFTNAPQSYFQAAGLAAQHGVRYWVQVTGGDPVSSALISNGWWGTDIQAIASYYSVVPANCSNCAPVTGWEPWNEPNNTGWGDASAYVNDVLEPFYQGVKAAAPADTVVGGSTVGVPISWWKAFVSAGGLNWLDVAAVHAYTGNNDSWEEDGVINQLQQVQSLLGSTPLWITELGWWSDADYNLLDQADEVARAMIWQQALHIPVWNYYFDEGSWGNDGISFSLIETDFGGDDYVKPAALAAMTTANQTRGLTFDHLAPTGVPGAYEAVYRPTGATGTAMAATWTDGQDLPASLTLSSPSTGSIPVTLTNQYGRSTNVTLTPGRPYFLPLSAEVSYVSYPAGDTATVGPTEPYGSNLALASGGTTATGSSGNPSGALVDPSAATSYGQGWLPAVGDTAPSITVKLAAPATIDRVVVDTQSVGSTAAGVRNYTVSVEAPDGSWNEVAAIVGQFRDHVQQVAFAPTAAQAVRLDVSMANLGGYYGGGVPNFWSPSWSNPPLVHAIEIYGGTGGPALINGSGLAALGAPGFNAPGLELQPVYPGTTVTPPASGTTTTTTTVPPVTTPPTTSPAAPSRGGTSTPVPKPTPPQRYWVTSAAGRVNAFGKASAVGSLATSPLKPVVGMASTPDGGGYWLVGSDGGVFAFGDARFYGSTGAVTLNKPIVGMAATSDGHGYWFVASDGGVFAFGDARFYGSTGGITLDKPIVGMAATPDGRGYWLVASDGGIFAFGDARFYGSTGGITLDKPIVGMAATSDGRGYWFVASDGGVFAFGDADFFGSGAAGAITQPVVGMAS